MVNLRGCGAGKVIGLPDLADRLILRDVRVLSNFLRRDDGSDPGPAVEYRLARPEEVEPALAMILGPAGAAASREQITDFLEFASLRRIKVEETWVASAGGRLAWAVLPILSPGHTALLFTPAKRPDGIDLAPLLDLVCAELLSRQVQLAQALLDPDDADTRAFFAARQFREMAQLLYLQTMTPRQLAPLSPPDSFWWRTYSADTHPLFERAILETYQQSLDCPALNGLRSIDDVIAGHKASGEFNPRFWYVLSERDNPVGVLLLSHVPRTDMAELVYLGLAPAARRRGLADLLMRHALWAVREMGLTRLTLAVDSQNAPALRLYYRHGLQRIGSKIAVMKEVRGLPSADLRVPDEGSAE